MKDVQKLRYVIGLSCILLTVALFVSCKKNGSSTPTSSGIAPDSAASGNVLTLKGSGLSNIRSIVFDKNNAAAVFNPNFNTDNAVIFRVPDTAAVGNQNIIFTNNEGKILKVSFKVLALAAITSASLYEFTAGTQITLTGSNLESASKVTLHGSTATATIVLKTATTLVITMPVTTLNKAKLDITNSAGTGTTLQEFISVDNAFQIYTDGFGPGVEDWSWCTSAQSSDFSVLGTKALKETYNTGSWSALSIHFDTNIVPGNYSLLTFWIKGGTADTQMDVASEQGGGSTNTITIPANVWTYYKMNIPGFLGGIPSMERLDFKMHGPDNVNQTVYVDDILFIK